VKVDYLTGNSPVSVATGDFKGDGKLDMAVVNSVSNTVSILLGKGDGTFAPGSTPNTGLSPVSVTVGDFNGDGKLDLAVVNQKDNTISILLNNGNATFQAHVDYATGANPASVTAVDLNGSGKLDLAVANSSDNTVSILLGDGKGSFSPKADYGTGNGPLSVIATDFNLDGKSDLAVANSSDNTVSVLLGNGDGTFQPQKAYPTGLGPVAVTFGDFNGDGRLDLAIANSNCPVLPCGPGSVSILLGNGDGTFGTKTDFATGNQPSLITVGNFNGDNSLDLAVANSNCPTVPCSLGPGSVSILLGNGNGSFQNHVDYGVGNRPLSVVAADFNGDGKLDLAVANFNDNTVSVLLGNGSGAFPSRVDYATGTGPASVTAADFNGDTRLDLVVVNQAANTVSILLGNGDGTFGAKNDFPTGNQPSSVTVGDFNGDGKLDLAVANSGSNTVSILLGNGDGTFQAHADYSTGAHPTSVAVANLSLTRPGELDLVVANRDQATVSVYLNLPLLAFYPASLNFGGQTVGTASTAETVTLSNPGSAPVSVGTITIAGANSGDFVESGCSGSTVGSGATCVISVTFIPQATGSRSATLTIADDAQGGPQLVALAGTGGVPGVPVASLLRTSLSFGNQLAGTSSAAQAVTLSNTGTAALSISSIVVGGMNIGDFAQSNDCGNSVGTGASCTINVTFTPSALGIRSAMITITDNAANSPQTVSLDGTGAGPIASLSAINLSFGGQIVGTTSGPQTATLTNIGTAALSVTSITIAGANSSDFAQSNTCGSSLNINATCAIKVTFTPRVANNRAGSVTIIDGNALGPSTINLSGSGEDFSLSAASSSASIAAGQAATYALGITPAGGFNQRVSLACTGAPQLPTCSVSPASVILNGSTALTATATVATIAPSTVSGGRFILPPVGRQPGLPRLLRLLLALVMLANLVVAVRRRRVGWRWGGVLLFVLFWAACGGGSGGGNGGGNPGTPRGTYSLTITGTYTGSSTTLQHSLTLTLKVE
jgi:hypothetical protein